jgi:hypothetical protein
MVTLSCKRITCWFLYGGGFLVPCLYRKLEGIAVQIRGMVSCVFFVRPGFLEICHGLTFSISLGYVASDLGQLESSCTSVNP